MLAKCATQKNDVAPTLARVSSYNVAQSKDEPSDLVLLREHIRERMRREAPKDFRGERAALARDLGVKPATVSNWLADQPSRHPKMANLLKYAAIRETTLRRLADEAGIALRPEFDQLVAKQIAKEEKAATASIAGGSAHRSDSSHKESADGLPEVLASYDWPERFSPEQRAEVGRLASKELRKAGAHRSADTIRELIGSYVVIVRGRQIAGTETDVERSGRYRMPEPETRALAERGGQRHPPKPSVPPIRKK